MERKENLKQDTDLDSLFSKRKPFGYDLKHAMENIRDHYTIPLEEAMVLENMDNCIEEPYQEIRFNIEKNVLEVEMLGYGMSQPVFWHTLPKLASTTKTSKKGLGHFGWGMKVGMFISHYIDIETKYEEFHGAQRWELMKDGPYWQQITKERQPQENVTIVKHHLNEEYAKKITPHHVKNILQKFYPTLLDGAPVLGRKLRVLINGEIVAPPQLPDIKEKDVLKAKIEGKEVTGKIFFTKIPLPEEKQGIAIIVDGRLICREYFGVFGGKNNQITGYLHADILEKDVAGDKTSIRKTSSKWRNLCKKISQQFVKFMKKVGALEEDAPIKQDLELVNKQLAKILKDFPELNPMKFSIKENVLIEKAEGEISSSLEKGTQIVKGTEGGEGMGGGVDVKPGDEDNIAPTKKEGKSRATIRKRKIRSGPQVRFTPQPTIRKESWFSEGEGFVYINTAIPSYGKAKKWGAKARWYHEIRCSLDALLEWGMGNERIDPQKYFDIRQEIFLKWGEI